MLCRCREAAAGVEAAGRARERTVGEGAVAAKGLRALASDAARNTGPECRVARSPDNPLEAEPVVWKRGWMDVACLASIVPSLMIRTLTVRR